MRENLAWALCTAAILTVASVAAAQGRSDSQSAPKPSPQVMTYLQQGSAYYQQRDFKRAIGPYSKALELEKEQPTLDKTLWRLLVDNLGMAYGISGDLKRAKATFEYGIGQDGVFPMFYYNLACTYAEMNDLENAISNLKLAFKYKENMIAGERFPNPEQDDSFRRFLKNDRFREALRELGPDDSRQSRSAAPNIGLQPTAAGTTVSRRG